jgi:hypothetical protein
MRVYPQTVLAGHTAECPAPVRPTRCNIMATFAAKSQVPATRHARPAEQRLCALAVGAPRLLRNAIFLSCLRRLLWLVPARRTREALTAAAVPGW